MAQRTGDYDECIVCGETHQLNFAEMKYDGKSLGRHAYCVETKTWKFAGKFIPKSRAGRADDWWTELESKHAEQALSNWLSDASLIDE